MKWMIFEDALCDLHGHWFELIETFQKEFQNLGDEVEIYCTRDAMPKVVKSLGAIPVLPRSIWRRMSDGSGPLKRFFRIPLHAIATFISVNKVFSAREDLKKHICCAGEQSIRDDDQEIIFVPTVLPHHLLGWLPLANKLTKTKNRTILFYFLSAPISASNSGNFSFQKTPSAVLLKVLIKCSYYLVKNKKVIFAAETRKLAMAISRASRISVIYLPQPVRSYSDISVLDTDKKNHLHFLSFGPARWEKGSDILQLCIQKFLLAESDKSIHFTIHWIDDFYNPFGNIITKNMSLIHTGKVEYIQNYLKPAEYAALLHSADALILPYRRLSYELRGSHVLLEGLVAGIPCITTSKTSPGSDLVEHGAGILVKDGDCDEIVKAMHKLSAEIKKYRDIAQSKKHRAADFFSVSNFKRILLGHL